MNALTVASKMAILAAQKVSEKTMREDQALVQEDIARNI